MKLNRYEPEEGYYNLYVDSEADPVLVYGYFCSDLDNVFVLGFNIADGGGLLPLSHLAMETKAVKVEIKEV